MTDEATMRRVLATYAEAVNTSRPRAAADCFTPHAVYLEPPDRQQYHGRVALFEFFGGDEPPAPGSASLVLHHLAFNEPDSLAFVEYTYQGRDTYHGIAIARFHDDLITSWREYQYQSPLPFDTFAGGSL